MTKDEKSGKIVIAQVDKKGSIRMSLLDSKNGNLAEAAESSTPFWSQSNIHSQGVKSVSLVEDGGKHLLTCSENEASLWSTKGDQPLMLFDEPSQGDHNAL